MKRRGKKEKRAFDLAYIFDIVVLHFEMRDTLDFACTNIIIFDALVQAVLIGFLKGTGVPCKIPRGQLVSSDYLLSLVKSVEREVDDMLDWKLILLLCTF